MRIKKTALTEFLLNNDKLFKYVFVTMLVTFLVVFDNSTVKRLNVGDYVYHHVTAQNGVITEIYNDIDSLGCFASILYNNSIYEEFEPCWAIKK